MNTQITEREHTKKSHGLNAREILRRVFRENGTKPCNQGMRRLWRTASGCPCAFGSKLPFAASQMRKDRCSCQSEQSLRILLDKQNKRERESYLRVLTADSHQDARTSSERLRLSRTAKRSGAVVTGRLVKRAQVAHPCKSCQAQRYGYVAHTFVSSASVLLERRKD